MRRLQTVALKTPEGETITPDWRQKAATVIIMLHDANCHACHETYHHYAKAQPQFAQWDAALWLVWRGNKIPNGCSGLLDESGLARRRWLSNDAAGVLLIDHNGVVVQEWGASGKGFPSPDEVAAAVKHAVLQCPE